MKLKEAFVKDLYKRFSKEEISFSRMVELLNEETEKKEDNILGVTMRFSSDVIPFIHSGAASVIAIVAEKDTGKGMAFVAGSQDSCATLLHELLNKEEIRPIIKKMIEKYPLPYTMGQTNPCKN
ncbi:MAG: hypothetical protein BGN96_10635 [Bacteroidales bacterium 45-6]|nr:MAG: hypothetical protein BGN96_10635 [Bacteroidales bacterium 45-6]